MVAEQVIQGAAAPHGDTLATCEIVFRGQSAFHLVVRVDEDGGYFGSFPITGLSRLLSLSKENLWLKRLDIIEHLIKKHFDKFHQRDV